MVLILHVRIRCRDADKTSGRVARVLNLVAELELMQAPGLAYSIPKEFDRMPRLTGGMCASSNAHTHAFFKGISNQENSPPLFPAYGRKICCRFLFYKIHGSHPETCNNKQGTNAHELQQLCTSSVDKTFVCKPCCVMVGISHNLVSKAFCHRGNDAPILLPHSELAMTDKVSVPGRATVEVDVQRGNGAPAYVLNSGGGLRHWASALQH